MTTIEATPPLTAGGTAIRARHAGFVNDVVSVAGRALRSVLRDVEFVVPAIIIPLFFFVVNIGALQSLTETGAPGFDYKAFILPACIVFGVTGISRAAVVVTDIQDGYFDRLLLTPIRRSALLLGVMVADIALVSALTLPVIVLALAVRVRFETGVLGVVALIVLSALWGLAFTGFPYAIALKTTRRR